MELGLSKFRGSDNIDYIYPLVKCYAATHGHPDSLGILKIIYLSILTFLGIAEKIELYGVKNVEEGHSLSGVYYVNKKDFETKSFDYLIKKTEIQDELKKLIKEKIEEFEINEKEKENNGKITPEEIQEIKNYVKEMDLTDELIKKGKEDEEINKKLREKIKANIKNKMENVESYLSGNLGITEITGIREPMIKSLIKTNKKLEILREIIEEKQKADYSQAQIRNPKDLTKNPRKDPINDII